MWHEKLTSSCGAIATGTDDNGGGRTGGTGMTGDATAGVAKPLDAPKQRSGGGPMGGISGVVTPLPVALTAMLE